MYNKLIQKYPYIFKSVRDFFLYEGGIPPGIPAGFYFNLPKFKKKYNCLCPKNKIFSLFLIIYNFSNNKFNYSFNIQFMR